MADGGWLMADEEPTCHPIQKIQTISQLITHESGLANRQQLLPLVQAGGENFG